MDRIYKMNGIIRIFCFHLSQGHQADNRDDNEVEMEKGAVQSGDMGMRLFRISSQAKNIS